jgi:hypothetical protein
MLLGQCIFSFLLLGIIHINIWYNKDGRKRKGEIKKEISMASDTYF